LYIKAINDGIFYNNELLNSENISDESLKQPESDEKSFGSNTKLYSTGYSVTETAEGGVTKTINYFLNQNLKTYSLLDNTSNAIEKSNILKNVDYKKLMEPVSANYHLVTYKKLIDTGVVQQQFVDEKGNEIAPTITSEKSDKGSTVTVATPPNEITYKGQTYLLQKENIPSSLVIKKGINSVTFRYKLQVVSEKGTPETHEVPAFKGGVSPSDAPVVEIPEYRGPLSVVGNPEVLEVPAFNGGVSPSDVPVVDIPEYRAPLSMVGNTEKLDFPKYKSPINGLDESAGQKRQIYTVKEKDLKEIYTVEEIEKIKNSLINPDIKNNDYIEEDTVKWEEYELRLLLEKNINEKKALEKIAEKNVLKNVKSEFNGSKISIAEFKDVLKKYLERKSEKLGVTSSSLMTEVLRDEILEKMPTTVNQLSKLLVSNSIYFHKISNDLLAMINNVKTVMV